VILLKAEMAACTQFMQQLSTFTQQLSASVQQLGASSARLMLAVDSVSRDVSLVRANAVADREEMRALVGAVSSRVAPVEEVLHIMRARVEGVEASVEAMGGTARLEAAPADTAVAASPLPVPHSALPRASPAAPSGPAAPLPGAQAAPAHPASGLQPASERWRERAAGYQPTPSQQRRSVAYEQDLRWAEELPAERREHDGTLSTIVDSLDAARYAQVRTLADLGVGNARGANPPAPSLKAAGKPPTVQEVITFLACIRNCLAEGARYLKALEDATLGSRHSAESRAAAEKATATKLAWLVGTLHPGNCTDEGARYLLASYLRLREFPMSPPDGCDSWLSGWAMLEPLLTKALPRPDPDVLLKSLTFTAKDPTTWRIELPGFVARFVANCKAFFGDEGVRNLPLASYFLKALPAPFSRKVLEGVTKAVKLAGDVWDSISYEDQFSLVRALALAYVNDSTNFVDVTTFVGPLQADATYTALMRKLTVLQQLSVSEKAEVLGLYSTAAPMPPLPYPDPKVPAAAHAAVAGLMHGLPDGTWGYEEPDGDDGGDYRDSEPPTRVVSFEEPDSSGAHGDDAARDELLFAVADRMGVSIDDLDAAFADRLGVPPSAHIDAREEEEHEDEPALFAAPARFHNGAGRTLRGPRDAGAQRPWSRGRGRARGGYRGGDRYRSGGPGAYAGDRRGDGAGGGYAGGRSPRPYTPAGGFTPVPRDSPAPRAHPYASATAFSRHAAEGHINRLRAALASACVCSSLPTGGTLFLRPSRPD
jgi:hypothetical protein